MKRNLPAIVLKSIKIFCLIGVALTVADAKAEEAFERVSLQRLFTRPLIVGASVSSGFVTAGPGTRATQMVMGTDTSVNIAHNGAEARSYMGSISVGSLANFSLVIGLDYLFWDTAQNDLATSRAALTNLISSAFRAGIPLVIGDIPRLNDAQNENVRVALNRQMHAQCRPSRHCYVLPIDRLHHQAVTRGLVINGYLYHYSDLSPDGIHINQVASDYVAGVIIQTLARGVR